MYWERPRIGAGHSACSKESILKKQQYVLIGINILILVDRYERGPVGMSLKEAQLKASQVARSFFSHALGRW